MRILVTGANGQLGSEMRLLAKNSADEFLFTDVNQVELRSYLFQGVVALYKSREAAGTLMIISAGTFVKIVSDVGGFKA